MRCWSAFSSRKKLPDVRKTPFPPLYAITDDRSSRTPAEQVRYLGDLGFPLVQLRCKRLSSEQFQGQIQQALEESRAAGHWPRVCLNDRIDLLKKIPAGLQPWGLHLGQEDTPVSEALALGTPGLRLGLSSHIEAHWRHLPEGVHHVGVGPIYKPRSKPSSWAPLGWDGFRKAMQILGSRTQPIIAIGGLHLQDLERAYGAGADSVAMITELSSAAHPERLLWEAQQERWHVRPLNLKQGVVLIGHSGSGKTSLGQDLAQRLGLAFVDLDHAIEKKTNQSISELFENQGEATFRKVEYQVALENLKPGQIIALGGGAWHQPDLRLHIKSLSLPVVVLAEPPRRCWTRLQSSTSRPLARSESDFLARCAQRAVDLQDLDEIYSCGRSTDDLANLLTYD